MKVILPDSRSAERLAAIARIAFEGRETEWTADDFLARAPDRRCLIIADETIAQALIILQLAADEAEIVNFGVVPDARRLGLGRNLLETAEVVAAEAGARRMFLEVAVDNTPARALYRAGGYTAVGERPGYYLRPDGSRADALIMAKALAA